MKKSPGNSSNSGFCLGVLSTGWGRSLFFVLAFFATEHLFAQYESIGKELTVAIEKEPNYRQYLENFHYPEQDRLVFVDDRGLSHTLVFEKWGIRFDGVFYELVSDKASGASLKLQSVEPDENGRNIKVTAHIVVPLKTVEQHMSYGKLSQLLQQLVDGHKVAGLGDAITRYERQ